MCGIAGIIAPDEQLVRKALPPMMDAQAHRGPDERDSTYLRFGNVSLGFGHLRLKIIDLSSSAHQPMIHPQTGDQIIFNGEIYNFQVLRRELEASGIRFRGHGDTETLLHALTEWGPEKTIPRLQGMFAFAYYEPARQRLVLARDSIGIKPLYIAQIPGGLIFASEVRALIASGRIERTLDPRGIAGLLAYGAVQHPFTLFKAIQSFPAGHYQILTRESFGNGYQPEEGLQRFWDFPAPDPDLTEQQAVPRIRQIIDDAVRDHLISDVPTGVFLSSGLDSTIVAGVAARHTPHLRSFTVGFEDQPDLSEFQLSRETAELFNLRHTEVHITNDDTLSATESWLRALDLPSLDGLNVYVISGAVRRQGITVALSGQGGDELFGGYPSFIEVPRLRSMASKAAWMPAAFRRSLARVATVGKSEAVRQKAIGMAGSDGGILSLYLHRRRAMSDPQLHSLGLEAGALGLSEDFIPPQSAADAAVDPCDITWSISRLESQFYMGNMLLRDGDADGMAHSLEIRVPLLDQRLLDFAFAIPGSVRLPAGGRPKHLLRAAFPELLRPALQRQGKRGFELPVRRWMLGPMRELCQSGLQTLKSIDLLRPQSLDSFWTAFEREPESPIWSRVFTLCVLGLYLKQTRIA
jgi:asparagine synthase (glutamine-hydrolysing)